MSSIFTGSANPSVSFVAYCILMINSVLNSLIYVYRWKFYSGSGLTSTGRESLGKFRNKEFRSEMKSLFKICSSKETKSMSTVTQTTRISSQLQSVSPEDSWKLFLFICYSAWDLAKAKRLDFWAALCKFSSTKSNLDDMKRSSCSPESPTPEKMLNILIYNKYNMNITKYYRGKCTKKDIHRFSVFLLALEQ